MAKGKKRVIQSGEDVCCKRKLVADLGGKYAPAMLANVIHQWCIHNAATNKNIIDGNAYTYMSYDWIAKNELPELSTDQVRTAMEMLIKKGIVEVAKIDRLENGRIPANYYRLSEKGARYFPRYIDMDESPENEAGKQSDPAEAKSETELREEIKAEVYNEIKASVLAELKMEQRQKRKSEKNVETDESLEKFFDIFRSTWNEKITKNPVRIMGNGRKRKIKKILEIEMESGHITRKEAMARLLMLVDLIAGNKFLTEKLSYGKGITLDWLLEEDMKTGDFENYTKITEGTMQNSQSLDKFLENM